MCAVQLSAKPTASNLNKIKDKTLINAVEISTVYSTPLMDKSIVST